MPKLIKNGTTEAFHWQILRDSDAVNATDLSSGHYLIPLSDWLATTPANHNVGVWLPIDTQPEDLTKALKNLSTIAIEFGSFMDGRGFSLAHILREDCDFTGELQAAGGFMQDQLFYLKRCGFDAFVVPDNADTDSMLTSLDDFSDSYQAACDEPRPLFRRR